MYQTDNETAQDHRQAAAKILREVPATPRPDVDSLIGEAQAHATLALAMEVGAVRELLANPPVVASIEGIVGTGNHR